MSEDLHIGCAGCGETYPEFLRECPFCGHRTDDTRALLYLAPPPVEGIRWGIVAPLGVGCWTLIVLAIWAVVEIYQCLL
jgi:hypothetical protein